MSGDRDDHGEQAWVDAGLLDPGAPNAEERRALLEYLAESGATIDDLRVAAEHHALRGVAADLRRRAECTWTARDVAAEAGVDVSRVLQVSRVAGLPTPEPDDVAYRAQDVLAVQIFVGAIELFGEQAAVEFTRSVGASLATIADSAMAVFGINVLGRFDERGASEVEQARATSFASQSLTLDVPRVLETLFFHHVDAAVRRSIASSGRSAATVRSAVGFVDLVRSTALVQELEAGELAGAIGAFEQLAVEVVAARDGRVVKTIGDEIMFVVPGAAAACDAVLALREAVAAHPRLPAVRGALAVGDLVRGYGDYYGPEVTIAARAVKLADPGSILVTEPVAVAAGDGFAFAPLGSRALRGFDDPVELSTVERA